MPKTTFKKGFKFANRTNTFEVVKVISNDLYECKMFFNGKLLRQKYMSRTEISNMLNTRNLPRWKA